MYYRRKFHVLNMYFVGSTASSVMITTGRPQSSATKTEIVDVGILGNKATCADLANFPAEIEGAVGVNLNGTPVVCRRTNQTLYFYFPSVSV